MRKMSRYLINLITLLMVTILISCFSKGQESTEPFQANAPRSLGLYYSILDGVDMHHNNDPPDNPISDNDRHYPSLEPDKELLELEAELRARHLLYDPAVRWLMGKAVLVSKKSRQWVIHKLRMRLEAESIEDIRSGDVFRPLAPKELLCQGDLHLLNQVDGVPWRIPLNALTRGALITCLALATRGRLEVPGTSAPEY